MSTDKDKNILKFLSKVILIALLIVFLIRSFLIESYTVSSTQMETAIEQGDNVLVNKTAYGIRMPITLLSIPFTFDTFFGRKSYSSLVEIPYKRFFSVSVGRNDIVLFNNPTEIEKPADKRVLILSRCIALPGDTIEMREGSYIIDNKRYVYSPDYTEEYVYSFFSESIIADAADEQDIPLRNRKQHGDTVSVLLNKYEAFIINQVIPDSLAVKHLETEPINYKFVIPYQGQTIALTDQNLDIYKQTILTEQENNISFVSNKLVRDGKVQEYYTFMEDHYWVLSDNKTNSIDSRNLGFIPFSHIVGRADYIWYSSDNGNTRWERCFSSLK